MSDIQAPDESSVNVINPSGKLVSIPQDQAQEALNTGYHPASPEDIYKAQREEKYGGLGQQVLTGAEGALDTATFGLAGGAENLASKIPGLETLGAEHRRAREETNPGVHTAGQLTGLVTSSLLLPGGGAAGVLEKAGTGAAEALGLGAKGASVLSNIGANSVKAATEMALLKSGDEVSKLMRSDPDQSIGNAAAHIGMAALLGAGGGAAFGAVAPLWKASVGDKVTNVLEGFKSRMGEHLSGVTDAAQEGVPAFDFGSPKTSNWFLDDIKAKAAEKAASEGIADAAEKVVPDVVDPGAKLADMFVKKGISKMASKMLGAAVGGIGGHSLVAAYLGKEMLGPLFESILPGIGKSVLEKAASSEGLKAALDYGISIGKGEFLLNKAANSLFNQSAEVLASNAVPSEKEKAKLDERVTELSQNPSKLLGIGETASYYLPDHAAPIAQTAMNGVKYLSSLKPNLTKSSPFDTEHEASPMQKATYDRALDIAQQPLIVFHHIKQGTLTPSDVTHMKTLYPGLYERASQKIFNGLIDTNAKKESVPYKTRLGLSLFLGQPLDSTMSPQGIQATQMANAMPAKQPQQQQVGPGPHSMKEIGKVANAYMTPQQAREAHKMKA